jgi:hypothetical protein
VAEVKSRAVATVEKSPEERKAILANVIAGGVKRGWHGESQTDYQVVLVRGAPAEPHPAPAAEPHHAGAVAARMAAADDLRR